MTSPEPVLVTSGTLRGWPLPAPGSDKESRGRVLVVGGSRQTPGAVVLAGEAALRAGGGKLQLATVDSVAGTTAVTVPESRVICLPETADGLISTDGADLVVEEAKGADVVLIGPGLPDVESAAGLMAQVLPHLDTTVVVDALASAHITGHPDALHHLDGRCVLTVNPTELARILGQDEDELSENPVPATIEAARRLRAVVLCGSSEKAVATPDGSAWLVQAGGPGLGISGSGDVQAGIVTGLLARGADPAQAAVWGAFLHGRAGEVLAVSLGEVGFLARELPAAVPGLLAELG